MARWMPGSIASTSDLIARAFDTVLGLLFTVCCSEIPERLLYVSLIQIDFDLYKIFLAKAVRKSREI